MALRGEALDEAVGAHQALKQGKYHFSPCQGGLGGRNAPGFLVLAALETPRNVALGTWVSSKVKSQVFLEFPGSYRVKWHRAFQTSCPDTWTSVQFIPFGFNPTYSRGGFFISKWACWVADGELMSPP